MVVMEAPDIAIAILALMAFFGAGYQYGRQQGRLDEARDRLKKYQGEP